MFLCDHSHRWIRKEFSQDASYYITHLILNNNGSFVLVVYTKFHYYYSMAPITHYYTWIKLSHLLFLLRRLKKCIIKFRFFSNFSIIYRTFVMDSAEVNKKLCITLDSFERRLNTTFYSVVLNSNIKPYNTLTLSQTFHIKCL